VYREDPKKSVLLKSFLKKTDC